MENIWTQVMLTCNLVLLFVAITCKTFPPLYIFELVLVSVSFEFRQRFVFLVRLFFTGLVRPFLKKNKQQNVMWTQLVFRYLGEVVMILKESSCAGHSHWNHREKQRDDTRNFKHANVVLKLISKNKFTKTSEYLFFLKNLVTLFYVGIVQ